MAWARVAVAHPASGSDAVAARKFLRFMSWESLHGWASRVNGGMKHMYDGAELEVA